MDSRFRGNDGSGMGFRPRSGSRASFRGNDGCGMDSRSPIGVEDELPRD